MLYWQILGFQYKTDISWGKKSFAVNETPQPCPLKRFTLIEIDALLLLMDWLRWSLRSCEVTSMSQWPADVSLAHVPAPVSDLLVQYQPGTYCTVQSLECGSWAHCSTPKCIRTIIYLCSWVSVNAQCFATTRWSREGQIVKLHGFTMKHGTVSICAPAVACSKSLIRSWFKIK